MESALEISAVKRARGQQNDTGFARRRGRGDSAQIAEQFFGVEIDGRDGSVGEQFGKQAHHHGPVFQHIGNAGRRAQIVFRHVEFILADPHKVDPGDMGVDAARHVESVHLDLVVVVVEHQFGGDLAGLHDLRVVVEIFEKHVQGADTLDGTARQQIPFRRGKNPGNQVERYHPLVAALPAIDEKRNSHASEQQFRFFRFNSQLTVREIVEPFCDVDIGVSHAAVAGAHLIEERLVRHTVKLESSRRKSKAPSVGRFT